MKTRLAVYAAAMLILLWQGSAIAKVDMATLPSRDKVQLTIYDGADLTLVREDRTLTLKDGRNRLEFSWANTLIDPTSLEILPKAEAAKLDILDLDFPPRVNNLGIWDIQSKVSGKIPMEISYLTSGFSWHSFYTGTLSADGKTLNLNGYVHVTNNSGEDYEDAQVRLIVGKINLIDPISDLARRSEPYGRPGPAVEPQSAIYAKRRLEKAGLYAEGAYAAAPEERQPKEIVKEGLSEYFLYTIEGTENIPNGWSKRLLSLSAKEVPVVNLYKYDEERNGNSVTRFLSFKNDKEHKLGDTPLPGGTLKVFRDVGDTGKLAYEGQSEFKYIPVDQDVELNLGPETRVIVKPTLMDFKTDRYFFDRDGNIIGNDESKEYEVVVKNTREIPVKVEIKRHCGTSPWELSKSGEFGEYEKIDRESVKFTLKLEPKETRKFRYILTTHEGRQG